MEKRRDTVRKVTMQNKRKKIIGYDKEKTELKELGEMLKNVEKYRALGVRIPRGLVLYGEPGVGKSVMARSMTCILEWWKRTEQNVKKNCQGLQLKRWQSKPTRTLL